MFQRFTLAIVFLFAFAGSAAAQVSLSSNVRGILPQGNGGTGTNASAAPDQVVISTGQGQGSWSSIANCAAGSGYRILYSTTSHSFICTQLSLADLVAAIGNVQPGYVLQGPTSGTASGPVSFASLTLSS